MGQRINSSEKVEKIGLIGCGRMGKCMLQAMIDNGYKVVVYDKFPQIIEDAIILGAEGVQTPAEIAANASIILMSLPGPMQIEEVIFGTDGLFEALTNEHIVIDTSTVAPTTSRMNSSRLAEKGVAYLDCPILGRPAAIGKWMLPAGGSNEALEKVKPILCTFAANVILVGNSGAGNALKLLNQLMFSCINAITSEVMAICDHVGISKKIFYDTVANSSAATVSGLFKEVGKTIINNNYELPAFTIDLLIKDTKLALQMAKDFDAPSVIAGTIQMYNEIAHANGLGMQDTSALYKVFLQHFQNLK